MAVAQALQDPTSRDVSWAPALVRIVALRAFPAHGRWVLQRFVETVERGSEEYQAAGLLILRALFEVEELDLGSSFGEADQARFAGVLSPFICTSLGCWALHVMKAAVNKGGDAGGACAAAGSGRPRGRAGLAPLHRRAGHLQQAVQSEPGALCHGLRRHGPERDAGAPLHQVTWDGDGRHPPTCASLAEVGPWRSRLCAECACARGPVKPT
ncbi:hypothetical protein ACKKBF_B31400 [Auxenochlorella protothecoides x Auxenochlorella symbiontica]